ncbi:hypothetical protein [Streptomyces virginiae]|uniref:hypothetical protein n=1 Tax=Streptomyces virginiae TaxID=1961 RepID=UPI0034444CE7
MRPADSEYFEGELGELFDTDTLPVLLNDVRDAVGRGVRSLATGEKSSCDVESAMSVLDISCSPRALIDGVPIVFHEQGPEGRRFGEYLSAFGNERVRAEVREAPTETH